MESIAGYGELLVGQNKHVTIGILLCYSLVKSVVVASEKRTAAYEPYEACGCPVGTGGRISGSRPLNLIQPWKVLGKG
jgi:hypothetical protein